MPKDPLASVLHYLRRVAYAGHGGASDAGLLDRFVSERDDAAFAQLVAIHGPMVLGLCQRLLRHHQDAEDAFQATFLALARKAGTISKKEALGGWLHKVAYRVACRARAKVSDGTNRMAALESMASAQDADVTWRDLRGVLDHEIDGLSESYRRLVVLCYLEGKTQEEAAHLLGCPKGTVAARLSRAKDQLRRRLTRRGWVLSTAALSAAFTGRALAVALPAGLARSTVRSALAYVSGQAASAGVVSGSVVALSEGVLRMMWLNKIKMAAGVVLAVVVAGTGVGLVVRQTWAGGGPGDSRAGNDAVAQNPKAKTAIQDDSKAEIANLRSEIAELRKEIKGLKDVPRQSAAPEEVGPTYQGKSTSFWLKQFKDADPKFRTEAVDALGSLARKNKELIPVLVTALNDEEPVALRPNVAQSAVPNLSVFGKDVVSMLVEVLNDKSSQVARRNAAEVLCLIGPQAKAAVPLLAQMLQEEKEDGRLRDASLRALQSIGSDAKSAIPSLIDLLGHSILAFRTQGEKEAWWKLPPPKVRKRRLAYPDQIIQVLLTIDPEIKNILPRDFEKSLNEAPRYEDLVSQWQKSYEVLKKHYQKEK